MAATHVRTAAPLRGTAAVLRAPPFMGQSHEPQSSAAARSGETGPTQTVPAARTQCHAPRRSRGNLVAPENGLCPSRDPTTPPLNPLYRSVQTRPQGRTRSDARSTVSVVRAGSTGSASSSTRTHTATRACTCVPEPPFPRARLDPQTTSSGKPSESPSTTHARHAPGVRARAPAARLRSSLVRPLRRDLRRTPHRTPAGPPQDPRRLPPGRGV